MACRRLDRGKRYLAERIVALIERILHRFYAESFVGQGGVFLQPPFRAQVEVINDLNRDFATLFNDEPSSTATVERPLKVGDPRDPAQVASALLGREPKKPDVKKTTAQV